MAVTLFSYATANATSNVVSVPLKESAVFQAMLSGTAAAAVTGTVILYGTNDPAALAPVPAPVVAGSVALKTFTLSATGAGAGVSVANDTVTVTAPYLRFFAVLSNVTGTGAAVTLVANYV